MVLHLLKTTKTPLETALDLWSWKPLKEHQDHLRNSLAFRADCFTICIWPILMPFSRGSYPVVKLLLRENDRGNGDHLFFPMKNLSNVLSYDWETFQKAFKQPLKGFSLQGSL